jgi:plasmid stabilization system protein ParE
MIYKYILHEHAQKDYEGSIKWYLKRSSQAADNFIKAVDNTLKLICEDPTRWRNTYKNFHELGLRKFPFTIIYEIDLQNELVIVSAIYHHKRNPRKKYRRI